MIPLKNKPNIIAPDSNYPYGRPRDNTGSGNGTPYNELVFNDYMQFFEKMMDMATLTGNGLRDNEYNGFQLNQALINNIIGLGEWVALDLSGSSFTDVGTPYFDASSRVNFIRGMIELRGLLRFPDSLPSGSETIGRITLGGGFFVTLDAECYVPLLSMATPLGTGGVRSMQAMNIQTDGTLVVPSLGGGFANLDYVTLDGICIPLTDGNLNIMP